MELNESVKKLLNAEHLLQAKYGNENPAWMSQMMAELSIWAGAVEEKLAEYEKNYEINSARLFKQLLVEEKLSASASDKHVQIEMGEIRGQIKYLTRIVGSAWRQVGVLQSRINHLVKLSETTNL